MIFLFLSILVNCGDDGSGNDPTPVPVTADLKKGSKVQEVTNTLLYSIELTNFTTIYTWENNKPIYTLTCSSHIVYIPTILRYLKVVDDVPNRTVTITPNATQKLKSVILKPGILVGVTFAILFLIGVIYTSLCRKPQAARRPKPVSKSNRGAKDDAFNRAKSNRARSASGHRSSGATRSTRSGSTHSQNGSAKGRSRSGSRGGSSRGGSRGGTHSSRGRTSNRL